MPTELDLVLFREDLAAVRELPEASRWELEAEESDLELQAVMYPRASQTELYKARLRWHDYCAPVSLKFLNIATDSDSDPAAWPICPGFRPAACDACLPWTAEGNALHPDWKNSARTRYVRPDNPMAFALLQIQDMLDMQYGGRGRA